MIIMFAIIILLVTCIMYLSQTFEKEKGTENAIKANLKKLMKNAGLDRSTTVSE